MTLSLFLRVDDHDLLRLGIKSLSKDPLNRGVIAEASWIEKILFGHARSSKILLIMRGLNDLSIWFILVSKMVPRSLKRN